MMGIGRKNQGQEVIEQPWPIRPAVPTEFNPPSVPTEYAKRSSRLSEEAGRHAQHVLDLENELAQVKEERDRERNARMLAEEQVSKLSGELMTANLERDLHKERHIEVRTRLRASAEILIRCLRDEDPPQLNNPPPPPIGPDHAAALAGKLIPSDDA